MNTSGDAAEQMVRLSLDGAEVVLKLTGSAAKNVAALLYALMKDQDKNQAKGKARLASMLKSGKQLTVFTIKNEELKQFVKEAKRYGVVYCVLRNSKGAPDELCDLMVRAEDAGKINRIVERFQFATVNEASIQPEGPKAKGAPDREVESKVDKEEVLDALFAKPLEKETGHTENPSAAKTVKDPLSEPSLKTPERTETGIFNEGKRASVKKELEEIKAVRKSKEEQTALRQEKHPEGKRKQEPSVMHRQPQSTRKRNRKKER